MKHVTNNLTKPRLLVGRASRQHGLTLVEMLVVVALTVLLMSIIAEVFVLASETMTTLRAISDVNQKIRTVESVIRIDLSNRTIREVQPPVERVLFGPGSDGIYGTPDDVYYVIPVGLDPAKNLGYFTIEEHSPADAQSEDTDDVIAFTVRLGRVSYSAVPGIAAAYYGHAIPGSEPDAAFPPSGDGLAGSLEAEVIYFLRKGTLYRRVLLVGVPQPTVSSAPNPWFARYSISARPPTASGGIPIVNTLGDLTYRSARYAHRTPYGYDTGFPTYNPPIEPGLATDFPGNTGSNGPAPNGSFPFLPIAYKEYQAANTVSWGYHSAQVGTDQLDHNSNYPAGISPALSAPEDWYGRPTSSETSARGTLTWNIPDDPASGVFSISPVPFGAFGQRAAEDALLTNVLSFNVMVWDPDARPYPGALPTGAYVDLGKMWPDPTGNSPSVTAPGTSPSQGTLAGLPGLSPGPPTGAQPGTWPPARPVGVTNPEGRGFAEPFGYDMQYAIPPGSPGLPLGMRRAPVSLCRTYDTWCTAYTKPTQVTDGSGNPVVPVAPPYIVPLRGIQIKIRFVEPDTRITREITIVQELR